MSEDTLSEEIELADFTDKSGDAPAKVREGGDQDQDGFGDDAQRTAQDLEAVFDIPVNIQAVIGRTHMEVRDLLKLDTGDVVELDRKVGEAIDIYVNDRLVARGEVVLVDDRLGVTMTEIIKGERNH